MRAVVAFVMAAFSITSVRTAAAPECPDHIPAVTVRVHDYAHLKGESLSEAQEIVTRLYRNVGVGIEWLGTLQMDVNRMRLARRRDAARAMVAQLTINLLTPSMAARGHVASDTIGFVAVPPEGGMGRIGYVVYDRVREIAATGSASESGILATILAYDIGGLILGVGSQSQSGVMKAHWDRRDLERVNPLALAFTPIEVNRLRDVLESSTPSSSSATKGAQVVDWCESRFSDEVSR